MVFAFTVASLNICNRWLLTTPNICREHKSKKACCSEQQKAVMHIGFSKLCTAAVHVNTAYKIVYLFS